VAALCAAIRDWTIAQIPGGAADLDQLICDGKTRSRPGEWCKSLGTSTPA
jgi:hypothetical protein